MVRGGKEMDREIVVSPTLSLLLAIKSAYSAFVRSASALRCPHRWFRMVYAIRRHVITCRHPADVVAAWEKHAICL